MSYSSVEVVTLAVIVIIDYTKGYSSRITFSSSNSATRKWE